MLTLHKDRFRGASEAVARVFLALGFTPNRVTLLSLALGLAACVVFIWNRNPVLFGFLILFCGALDVIDGTLARITKKTTRFGSYLDAMCDRVFGSAAIFSAAYVTGYWALSFLLVVGSLCVSYAKARAAMEVPVSNTEWPDFMEKAERDIVFAVGLILSGIFSVQFFGKGIFFWTLVLLNICVYLTFFQRIARAYRLIFERQ